jgi:hypothetical protein
MLHERDTGLPMGNRRIGRMPLKIGLEIMRQR